METDVIKEDGYIILERMEIYGASGPESESPDEKCLMQILKNKLFILF